MKKLGSICFVTLFTLSAQASSMYGVLMVVKGSVKIQNASKSVTDAKVGSRVVEGDTVTTGVDSRAKIVMSDRNVLNVTPETVLVIAKYENDAVSGKKNVEVNLLQGKVRSNVEQSYDGEKNKFLIKTPTAVAGVRGTQFLAGFDVKTQRTSIVTFKGAVTLATVNAQGVQIGAPVTILKGQRTQAPPDAAPEAPKAIPREEMQRIEGETAAANLTGQEKRDVANEREAQPTSAPPPPPAPPSMVDARDVDPGMAREIKDVRAPSSILPPPRAPNLQPTPNPMVKDIIRDGTGKARVNVVPVTPP